MVTVEYALAVRKVKTYRKPERIPKMSREHRQLNSRILTKGPSLPPLTHSTMTKLQRETKMEGRVYNSLPPADPRPVTSQPSSSLMASKHLQPQSLCGAIPIRKL